MKCVKTSGKDEGFELLGNIYSRDLISYYNKLLDFNMNVNQATCQLNAEDLYIKDNKKGQKIPGTFTMFKEFYYEAPNRFIVELYYVFKRSDVKMKGNTEIPKEFD